MCYGDILYIIWWFVCYIIDIMLLIFFWWTCVIVKMWFFDNFSFDQYMAWACDRVFCGDILYSIWWFESYFIDIMILIFFCWTWVIVKMWFFDNFSFDQYMAWASDRVCYGDILYSIWWFISYFIDIMILIFFWWTCVIVKMWFFDNFSFDQY